MVKRCAIYVRKSKANDNSDSMETQISMCKEYLEQQFPSCVIRIYDKDYGITGHSIKKRKDFQRMMDDVKNHDIDIVAIQRYDRIARNTRDFCNIFYDMERVGCELVSVSQRIDTSTPYGKKFMYDLASTAELEWALNSERHKDVNRYARLNKKCTLSPYAIPFGLKVEKIDGVNRVVIDKDVEHIVRDAINHYMTHHSKAKTVRYINEKYNLQRSHSFIDTIIRSDFYHGEYREVSDYCEPYMTKEEHTKMRKISTTRSYPRRGLTFLFTGLLVCPVCGSKMEAQSQGFKSGKRYYYYRCYNVYRTGKCTFKGNINERLIEDYLANNAQALISNFSVENDYFIKEKSKPQNKAKYKAELERLNNMFLKGRISEEYYDSEYERLHLLLDTESSNDEFSSKRTQKELEDIFNKKWLTSYEQLSRENKRAFWQNTIDKITFNEDKTVNTVYFL